MVTAQDMFTFMNAKPLYFDHVKVLDIIGPQGGNCIFPSDETKEDLMLPISYAFKDRFGLEPGIIIYTYEELLELERKCPYRHLRCDPRGINFFFFVEPPTIVNNILQQSKKPDEMFHVTDHVMYFYSPRKVKKTKIAIRHELRLGTESTLRNLQNVRKLLELAKECQTEMQNSMESNKNNNDDNRMEETVPSTTTTNVQS
jgi:uncharacterized protein (DUF1697 family)